MAVVPDWAKTGGLKPGQAVAGTAFAEQRPVRTDDYLVDERFVRDDAGARVRRRRPGIRSVIAVPLPRRDRRRSARCRSCRARSAPTTTPTARC